MKKIMAHFCVIVLAISLLWISDVSGATITADSCSRAHVQDAIDDASTGDIVVVPNGSATWDTTVTIPDAKKLIFIGAGEESTIITWPSNGEAVRIGGSGSRVTGFKFIFPSGGHAGSKAIYAYGRNGWRIDHCYFDNQITTTTITAVFYGGTSNDAPVKGLVDNCTFENAKINGTGSGSTDYDIWYRDLDLGTDDAVYVEDCTFIKKNVAGDVMDGVYGSSYVFRFNNVTDGTVETHSLGGSHRAGRKWEVYGNNFTSSGDLSLFYPFRERAGTGIYFSNTVTGDRWSASGILIDNVRSYEGRDTCGACNGASTWDGNDAVTNGTGNATSADANGLTLTDSGKSWTIDTFWLSVDDGTGKRQVGENASALTLSSATRLSSYTNLKGFLMRNTTDESWGIITTHTTTAVTATLQGGTDNDWDVVDDFIITNGCTVYNVTDGSNGQIYDNNGTTVTAQLSGGTDNQWEIGDEYKISCGYPCRDQIGRSKDASAWDGTPPAPIQSLEPAYEWSNTSGYTVNNVGYSQVHIVENQDFYNENGSFDGISGVGVGVLASRPATCTTGVAYWATDQGGNWNKRNADANDGCLYKCTSTNMWTLYYRPYTYPHPLTKPEPPSNLRISN